MLALPKQSVKCFLNADLNGQLELDTKEPQVADLDFDHLYMFSVEGIYYPVNKDNVLAYFYDEDYQEYLVIKKGFYTDCMWKQLDEEFFKVQHAWDSINPI
ncbi:hypothetical protein P9Y62_02100 [Bacillus thuringiensis]|uniref:Uncharacterized protein n=6 Tax=Bacillus cereus group TaxID=86661 RepID=A1BZE0_BACCE|nr:MULTISPECIES: hypothetical protein [Bacillus cereus group]EEM38063.1 hypothetical protein bthur0004_60590 [Bacillus thuringiensis serovar sotto str. T04001]ABK00863.1 hypothetical protein pPER272_AH820_0110 [Bacillus cereus]ABK01128.1 hypothetical protein pPER272_0110 [Bacillus cereus]ACK92737.1 conserved hypothetical protein [Bacillus cereus AH820]AFQ19513.1 hypothetical protein BTG_30873 [Bacillus thuringiensis HD-771]